MFLIYDYAHVIDELKHWVVLVEQCLPLVQGEQVFLCLSKYALTIVQNYLIIHHFLYHASQVEMTTRPNTRVIEVTVCERAVHESTGSKPEKKSINCYFLLIKITCNCLRTTYISII